LIDPASGSVNAADAWFGAAVTGIFTALVDRAAAAINATRKYFATGVMDFDPKLYGLAQCAPDLTPAQCQSCLGDLQSRVTTQFLSGRPLGNNAFHVWCSLRYSVSPFYAGRAMLQLPAPPAPPPTATPTPHSSGLNHVGVGHTSLVFLQTKFLSVTMLTLKHVQNSSNDIVHIRLNFRQNFSSREYYFESLTSSLLLRFNIKYSLHHEKNTILALSLVNFSKI
jgi:hypothetical protein